MLNIDNYFIDEELRVDRTDTRGGIGGGLLVYVRKDVIVRPVIDEICNFNQYCKFDVLREGSNQPLNVTLVYRSPNSNADNTLELAKIITSSKKNTLIIGDINLPSTDFSVGTSNAKGRPILEAVADKFLENLVDFPTHLRGNSLDCALADESVKR